MCRRIAKKVSRLLEKKIAREIKVWIRKWLARRSTHGASALL